MILGIDGLVSPETKKGDGTTKQIELVESTTGQKEEVNSP